MPFLCIDLRSCYSLEPYLRISRLFIFMDEFLGTAEIVLNMSHILVAMVLHFLHV